MSRRGLAICPDDLHFYPDVLRITVSSHLHKHLTNLLIHDSGLRKLLQLVESNGTSLPVLRKQEYSEDAPMRRRSDTKIDDQIRRF